MAQIASQIRVATFGRVYIAPVGSAVADTPNVPLIAPFVDLGLCTEDGVTFEANPTIEEIRSWQSNTASRRFVTGRDVMCTFTLQQTNPDALSFAYGGGTVTETAVASGIFQYDPPSDTEDLAEYVLVVDSQDGNVHDRYEIYKGSVTESVSRQLQRTAASELPISFAALTPDALDKPWRFLTDDPAFA